jgi:hypothetical protein
MKKESDRRSRARFPIHRELRYKVLQEAAAPEAGTGMTVNVSSGGVLFSINRELNPGCFVELSISWPVLLDDTCLMRLIAFGRVLRSANGMAACSIDKYEFRTQARSNVRPIELHRSDSMLVRWANGLRKESVKSCFATA